MKNKFLISICAVILVMALLLAGCSNNQVIGEPSNYGKLAPALGLSKEETCKVIGIQQEDMTEIAKETFTTPLTAELAGQTFDVLLSFNALSEEKELLQIKYQVVYPDLSDTTVQAVDDIVAALGERYGEPTRQSDSRKEDERLPAAYTYWDLTETVSEDLSAYMKQLEAEYGGTAYYELILHISQDEDACIVGISYVVGVTPSK